jgi:sulfonate dioxygenase
MAKTATADESGSKEALSYDINLPYGPGGENYGSDKNQKYQYQEYLPTWEPIFFERLRRFDYQDPALRVENKTKPNLLQKGAEVTDIQPGLGTIVEGVQLGTLSDAAKDELALLIAERKVVVFPDQDLIDAGPESQQNFMRYFGKPNYQPVSGTVKGYPGFHIIHRNGNKDEIRSFLEQRTTTTLWHQDVSYEIQPPGYVMLGMLQGPEVGGDTVFTATDAAYKCVPLTLKTQELPH